MSESEVVFLAPLPGFRRRTRLVKMAKMLLSRGSRLQLLGWERQPGEIEKYRWDHECVNERVILRGGGYASLKARSMYPLWMVAVFWRVLLMPRHTLCFCLGWETAFPALVASWFSSVRIVFDDADRFSMLINLPGPLHSLLVALERWTSRRSLLHVVPGWSRYEWRFDNMVLLRNSPLRSDYAIAKSHALEKPPADLVLYVNGWIAWDTGAKVFLEALRLLDTRGVDSVVNVAGRVVSAEGEALLKHPRVIYYGELPQSEALALYLVSDVALTFYDPKVRINHFAESNKWGDCVFLSTPFIVNSEVQTAREFVENGAAFSVPYNDSLGLCDMLERLARDKKPLESCKAKLAEMRTSYAPYDEQFADLMNRIELA